MNSVEELWSKRIKDYWNMAIRYLRLIGNSGFLFTIYLAIIVGSYYYAELLRWLPENFPAALLLAVITALLLTKSPVRTFVKEGDLVFLSPIEGKLASYFRSSFYYSLVMQGFVIVLIIVLFTPLYRHFIVDDAHSLLFIIVVLLLSKGWNLLAQFEEGRLLFSSTRTTHKFARFIVNITLTYLLFVGASIYFIIAVVVIKSLLLIFYYQPIKKQHSLKWEHLIEVEERMVMTFYRIANMFTDVPKLRTKVKSHKILSAIPNLLSFNQSSTFSYLYLKSFIRANDYFGIYSRLMIIGVVLLFYVQIDFGKLFVALLIIYMSALQLSTLSKHHDLKLWIDLYPIDQKMRRDSFRKIVFGLLLIKTTVFAVATWVATVHFVETSLVFLAGIVMSYAYCYFLLHKRIS